MSALQLDTSAILWSAPERERADRPLLVLLHGYGSHEGDLFGMSPALPLAPVIASLRAPIAESGGWAWYSRVGQEAGNPDATLADDAAIAVLGWLDTVEYTTVSVLGFSQGAAIALQLLRHAPTRFASTVALAGFVAGSEHPGDDALAAVRPPVFWGRGTADHVIPEAAIERTETWLPLHTDATIRTYDGIGHSISQPEIADVAAFLTEHR